MRRLLAALIEQKLLSQNETTRRYYLGLELFSLGALAGQRLNLRRASVDALARLTDETQDTVFLSIPDGRDSLCIARYEGEYPIRTLTMSVGDRRPMGVGAGSLAILSAMSDADVDEVLRSNVSRYVPYAPEISVDRLREKVQATRAAGVASSTFFLSDGKVMPGMNAIGIPIVTELGIPIGAVSVAAVPERLAPRGGPRWWPSHARPRPRSPGWLRGTDASPMKIKSLQYFLQIAEIGSLTQAAAVLYIAQPALSRQMQQLEDELG